MHRNNHHRVLSLIKPAGRHRDDDVVPRVLVASRANSIFSKKVVTRGPFLAQNATGCHAEAVSQGLCDALPTTEDIERARGPRLGDIRHAMLHVGIIPRVVEQLESL